jgi:hypothetical protein
LIVHLGAKEPRRASSKTEFMYIPIRTSTVLKTTRQLHLLLQFIPISISWNAHHVSVLEESSDIDTQIRAATEAFVAMKEDVFFDKKISGKTRMKQLCMYADSNELCSMEYDYWAFNATDIAKPATCHHECAQSGLLHTVSRWDRSICEHSEARIRITEVSMIRETNSPGVTARCITKSRLGSRGRHCQCRYDKVARYHRPPAQGLGRGFRIHWGTYYVHQSLGSEAKMPTKVKNRVQR